MRSKSYNKLLSSRNSSVSADSHKVEVPFTQSHCQLSTLKRRKQLSEPQVSNQLAAKVVKNYLLPMFESKFREKSHTERQKLHGIEHKRSISIIPGTVYEELKLVEQLSDQISTLTSHLSVAQQEIREAIQEKEFANKELKQRNEEILNLSINLQYSLDENRHLSKNVQKLNQKLAFSSDRGEQHKLSKSISLENVKFKQELQEFKSINDIRLFKNLFSLTIYINFKIKY